MVKTQDHRKLAIASLVIGIASLLLCWLIGVNFILAVLAIIFGAMALKSSARGQAIAGLVMGVVSVIVAPMMIFLMVFIALPSLQVSQRDSLAKSTVTTVQSAIFDYSADNMGKLPSSSLDIQQYAKLSSGTSILVYDYGQDYVTPNSGSGDVLVMLGATCHEATVADGVNPPLFDVGTNRSYAVATVLERNNQFYCVD